jgi:hypothetical protein
MMAVGMTLLSEASSSKRETAVIIDSGSTNRAGFRIEVNRSGIAEMTSVRRKFDLSDEHTKPLQRTLSSAAIQRVYADLKAARPLRSLPQFHCMKSASFGSTLTIVLGNEQTPDLSCGDGGNAAMRNLIRDVHEIIAVFQNKWPRAFGEASEADA